MPRPLVINASIVIPSGELLTSFVRSSGPGGQNVNKVNSKALLRWNVRDSTALSHEVKVRFESCFPTRITQAGDVILTSDKYRDQGRNLADCYEKLRQLIQASLIAMRGRRNTRPTRGSIEDRLSKKRQRSSQKKQRGFRPYDET